MNISMEELDTVLPNLWANHPISDEEMKAREDFIRPRAEADWDETFEGDEDLQEDFGVYSKEEYVQYNFRVYNTYM